MNRISPCLWFNGQAEEAATFYAGIFPDSSVDRINRAPADYPAGHAGDVLTVEFTLLGLTFLGLNAGPAFTFDQAVSFQVYTKDQAETDRYWDAIVSNGGSELACSWCRDRYGLCWQIVPEILHQRMTSDDGPAAQRAMQAMMTMRKIDIEGIEQAYRGE